MGPRLGSRGKNAPYRGERIHSNRFNGAATWKSRKEARKSTRLAKSHCFNGAATWKSRKGDLSQSARVPLRRFNGAATWKSRKARRRQEKHKASRRFNGAATWKSRKALQRFSRKWDLYLASMGPRLGSRGKIDLLATASPITSLQWGRDLEVAES